MLTQKQEDFCLAYIETGNASEAYRRAYNAEKMKVDTVWREACELMGNPKVAARIAELRSAAAQAATLSLTEHLQRLHNLSIASEAAEKYEAAIKAEELRGKASGFYKEKVEHSGNLGVEHTVSRELAESMARELIRQPG